MNKPPKSLCYYGGKSPYGGRGTGRWVASLLPNPPGWTYCEPFAGMCGVLLQREPRGNEIINDHNGDIANFWRQLRDNRDELGHKIICTPQSREILAEARATLDGKTASDLDRAWATYTVLKLSMMSLINSKQFSVSAFANPNPWRLKDVTALCRRIRDVTIENCDGAELIERLARSTDRLVIYADPPYPSATGKNEYQHTIDVDRLTSALQSVKGFAAISGYPGEWEHLGWKRHEFETLKTATRHPRKAGAPPAYKKTKIVKCLWTNYPRQTNPPRRAV